MHLYAIEPTRPRGQHRADGVGRPKFEFDAGPCLISASRIHCCDGTTPACSEPWMFSCSFEKPIGSQGPSPGMGSPAWTPPDMPLSDAAASAFNAVDAAGAAGATRPAAGAMSARQTATWAIFS